MHAACNGGPRMSNTFWQGFAGDFATFPGHFNHVGNGAWDFHPGSRLLKNNTSQTWHTIEWRFKLSETKDTSAEGAPGTDGIFQLWFDGVEQVPVELSPGLDPSTNPTAANGGSGYNMLVMFDNIKSFHREWNNSGIEGGIWVNDLVISTTRIGHDYFVGDPLPNPPSDVAVE